MNSAALGLALEADSLHKKEVFLVVPRKWLLVLVKES